MHPVLCGRGWSIFIGSYCLLRISCIWLSLIIPHPGAAGTTVKYSKKHKPHINVLLIHNIDECQREDALLALECISLWSVWSHSIPCSEELPVPFNVLIFMLFWTSLCLHSVVISIYAIYLLPLPSLFMLISMLKCRYCNQYVDKDALIYLVLANEMLHELHPDIITIAEDVSCCCCTRCPFHVNFCSCEIVSGFRLLGTWFGMDIYYICCKM